MNTTRPIRSLGELGYRSDLDDLKEENMSARGPSARVRSGFPGEARETYVYRVQ